MSPTSILSLMNNQLNTSNGNELFPQSGLASPWIARNYLNFRSAK